MKYITEYFNKAHFALSAKESRREAEKRAVLAQSSFRRIRLIGRTPDSAGARSVPAHARRKRAEGKRKKELCLHKALLDAFV